MKTTENNTQNKTQATHPYVGLWVTEDGYIRAVDVVLSKEELGWLNDVSQLPAEYPSWMLGMWSQARVQQLEDARR
jgi:hypothetical protein